MSQIPVIRRIALAHKLLRRLVFVPVVGLALTAPALSRNGRAYRTVALCEGLLHGAALAAQILGRRPRDDTWEPQRADPDLDVRRGAGRHERSA